MLPGQPNGAEEILQSAQDTDRTERVTRAAEGLVLEAPRLNALITVAVCRDHPARPAVMPGPELPANPPLAESTEVALPAGALRIEGARGAVVASDTLIQQHIHILGADPRATIDVVAITLTEAAPRPIRSAAGAVVRVANIVACTLIHAVPAAGPPRESTFSDPPTRAGTLETRPA